MRYWSLARTSEAWRDLWVQSNPHQGPLVYWLEPKTFNLQEGDRNPQGLLMYNKRTYQREWKANRRAIYLTGKSCTVCGSTEFLEIDHIDPATKHPALIKIGYNGAQSIWSWSPSRREAELAKCQVLCKDHHKEKTIERKRTSGCSLVEERKLLKLLAGVQFPVTVLMSSGLMASHRPVKPFIMKVRPFPAQLNNLLILKGNLMATDANRTKEEIEAILAALTDSMYQEYKSCPVSQQVEGVTPIT